MYIFTGFLIIFMVDSFRFLTPAPVATSDAPVVNEIARQAGANPISVPTDNPSAAPTNGEVSPTGVADISIYPSWTDSKDPPDWYAKGADVDALLDVAGSLDWLADTGDLHENFTPPPIESSDDIPDLDVSPTKIASMKAEQHNHVHHHEDIQEDTHVYNDEEHHHHLNDDEENNHHTEAHLTTISSSAELPQTMDDSNVEQVVPPLPSFFDGAPDSDEHYAEVHHNYLDHKVEAENHNVEDHPETQHPTEESTTMDVPTHSTSASDLLLTSTPSSAKLTLKDDDVDHHQEHNHPAANGDGNHSTDAGELGEATLFDAEMEHDFVSTILENSESAVDLAALHADD